MTALGVAVEANAANKRLSPTAPALKPGVHLRWAFAPSLGFPRGGFYLFRRAHSPSTKFFSVAPVETAPANLGHNYSLLWQTVGAVLVRSDANLVVEQPDGPHTPTVYSLAGRQSLRFDVFPRTEVSSRAVITFGAIDLADVEVAAYTGEQAVVLAAPVAAGLKIEAELEFDFITGVEIRSRSGKSFAAGVVKEVKFYDVKSAIDASASTSAWTPLNTSPIRLPVTHPDYYCTAGKVEDEAAERARARSLVAYGSPDFAVPPTVVLSNAGKVLTQSGSPLVQGIGSDWVDSFAGGVLTVAGEGSVYAISAILGAGKLLLSRPYEGPNGGAPQTYSMERDTFGELYDYAVNLVRKGAGGGPMADREVPAAIAAPGLISVRPGSDIVDGAGVVWGPEIEGVELIVIGASAGVVSVGHGSAIVTGDAAAAAQWKHLPLAGMEFVVAGRPSSYYVQTVNSDGSLTLNRPFDGDSRSSLPYSIVEKTVYQVVSVSTMPARLKLDRPYAGSRTGNCDYRLGVRLRSAASAPDSPAPNVPQQKPLDLVLLYAMHPAFAQMLGLYWIDDTVKFDSSMYDYLLVADYGEKFGTTDDVLSALAAAPGDQYAFLMFKRGIDAPNYRPLDAPVNARAWDLPGLAVCPKDRKVYDASAGLTWDLAEPGIGALLPNRALMYHVWRADLGADDPAIASLPPADSKFVLLTEGMPVMPFNAVTPRSLQPPRPPRWPGWPLQYIDRGLDEGWYCYQLHGVDIFGRHSVPGASAEWRQWTPAPVPRPWYYTDVVADGKVDRPNSAQAIHILDQVPPSPPTAVEAIALDPVDPMVVKDARYQSWFATLTAAEKADPQKVGLRVRWQWTPGQQFQSPDTREFRIYFQSGHLNSLRGRIMAVEPGKTQSVVTTDMEVPAGSPADAFAGGFLQVAGLPYRILSSEASSPLRVTVRNFGSDYDSGKVTVKAGSPTVQGTGTAWSTEMAGSRIRISNGGESTEYTILAVTATNELKLSTCFEGTPSATPLGYLIYEFPPEEGKRCVLSTPADYTGGFVVTTFNSKRMDGWNTVWASYMVGRPFQVTGDSAVYTVVSVDEVGQIIMLDRPFEGPTQMKVAYAIRNTAQFTDFTQASKWERRYYAVAHDDAAHYEEDADGVRRYEMLFPLAGETERNWLPLAPNLEDPIVYANIGVSASDDKDHALDDRKWDASAWGKRAGNESGVSTPARIFRVLRAAPPAPEVASIAPAVWATAADFHNRSFYTFRWKPQNHLRAHIVRALDDALFSTDWSIKVAGVIRRKVTLADKVFPAHYTTADKQAVIVQLDKLYAIDSDSEALNFYRHTLDNNTLRVIASLPGNDVAFTQVTVSPLDLTNSPDQVGPDDRADYTPDATLCGYTDTLDGGSTNRFFYRALFVDDANNRSGLSLASSPVCLPNVVPPHVPVVLSLLATANREITIKWYANNDSDLAGYYIYRTDDIRLSRDVRLMTLVRKQAPTPGAATESWVDDDVAGRTTYFYRIAADDTAANLSEGSAAVTARAYDLEPPSPPEWTASGWRADGNGIDLTWKAVPGRNFQYRVYRKTPMGNWASISAWSETPSLSDWTAGKSAPSVYRISVQNESGNMNAKYLVLEVALPA